MQIPNVVLTKPLSMSTRLVHINFNFHLSGPLAALNQCHLSNKQCTWTMHTATANKASKSIEKYLLATKRFTIMKQQHNG